MLSSVIGDRRFPIGSKIALRFPDAYSPVKRAFLPGRAGGFDRIEYRSTPPRQGIQPAGYRHSVRPAGRDVSYPRVTSWACRWTPALRAPRRKPHAPSVLRRGFLRWLSARESERRVLRPRLRGWLMDSPSIRGLLPLMDVCYRSSRSQIKLTRFLPPLKRVGFRAGTAVTEWFFGSVTRRAGDAKSFETAQPSRDVARIRRILAACRT